MQNNQYNLWEDPNVPFELKAEQNLFWLIYDENRSLYRRMKKKWRARGKDKRVVAFNASVCKRT